MFERPGKETQGIEGAEFSCEEQMLLQDTEAEMTNKSMKER